MRNFKTDPICNLFFYTILILFLVSNLIFSGSYPVNNADEIRTIMSTAEPGDTLIMTNGTWLDQLIEFEGEGAEQDSIYLIAETPGEVIISGESYFRLSGKYLVVSGLNFKDGVCPSGDVFRFKGNLGNAEHCRLTQTSFIDYNPVDISDNYKWLSVYGSNNRVDHCYFSGKTNEGVTFAVWFDHDIYEIEQQPTHNHRIDHNYFGYRPPYPGNGGETLRIGTSTYSMGVSQTTVEYNYFEQCNGEVEIISNKSCENIYQYNTFYECAGSLVLRHGNRNIVQGNFFFGNNKPNTGGIRIVGEDQLVVNNYLENLQGVGWYAAMSLMNGVPDSPLNRYFQVQRANVLFNTLVDCQQPIYFGQVVFSSMTLPPLDCVIANNLIRSDNTIIRVDNEPINLTWEGNLMDGDLGISSPNGITLTELNFVQNEDSIWRISDSSPAYNNAVGEYSDIILDMDGQSRDIQKDVGADEFSTETKNIFPVTREDVGPDWFQKIDNTFLLKFDVEGSGVLYSNILDGKLEAGTAVWLEAVPNEGWKFVSWGNDISEITNPITFFLEKDIHIITTFQLITDISSNEIVNINKLYSNYPNPFNPSTKIKYSLAQSGLTNISVYDLLGRKVMTLLDEYKSAGNYEINMKSENLPSGSYFYIITNGNYTELKKMLLVK